MLKEQQAIRAITSKIDRDKKCLTILRILLRQAQGSPHVFRNALDSWSTHQDKKNTPIVVEGEYQQAAQVEILADKYVSRN